MYKRQQLIDHIKRNFDLGTTLESISSLETLFEKDANSVIGALAAALSTNIKVFDSSSLCNQLNVLNCVINVDEEDSTPTLTSTIELSPGILNSAKEIEPLPVPVPPDETTLIGGVVTDI